MLDPTCFDCPDQLCCDCPSLDGQQATAFPWLGLALILELDPESPILIHSVLFLILDPCVGGSASPGGQLELSSDKQGREAFPGRVQMQASKRRGHNRITPSHQSRAVMHKSYPVDSTQILTTFSDGRQFFMTYNISSMLGLEFEITPLSRKISQILPFAIP